MDVDNTATMRNIPFVGDMSIIQPSALPSSNLLSADGSPIKAGMETPSSPYPTATRQPRRSPRNTTMPPPSKTGGSARKTVTKTSGTTPQQGGKHVKKTLKHSVSASVLPRQSDKSQPISFR